MQSAAKLRIILAGIKRKQEQGFSLTVREGELLAECYRQMNQKPRETITTTTDGKIVVQRTMELDATFAAMKDYEQTIRKSKARAKLEGSVDPVTLQNWANETGLKPNTAEFNKWAIKRIREDSDYRKFRAGN